MNSKITVLKDKWPDNVYLQTSLAKHTSFVLGGRALGMVVLDSKEDLRELLKYLKMENIPYFILGGGTNVLFSDEDFQGTVIKLGNSFNWISYDNNKILRVGAATPTPKLLSFTMEHGLSGLEIVAGIPGKIGGALKMNAGTSFGSIGECLHDITWIEPDGEIVFKKASDVKFSYRDFDSLIKGSLIIEASWKLEKTDPSKVKDKVKYLLNKRKTSQPKGLSAGCIFKNTKTKAAGQIIDELGLKGLKKGGAKVSLVHANFIVCEEKTTSNDIWELIKEIQYKVFEKTGINLQLEIETLGFQDLLKESK